MSVKIKVSYTEETEVQAIMKLLAPIMDYFRVKKSAGTTQYKHLYFTPKNGGKP